MEKGCFSSQPSAPQCTPVLHKRRALLPRCVRRCKLWVYLGPLPVMIAPIERPLRQNKKYPEAFGIHWQSCACNSAFRGFYGLFGGWPLGSKGSPVRATSTCLDKGAWIGEGSCLDPDPGSHRCAPGTTHGEYQGIEGCGEGQAKAVSRPERGIAGCAVPKFIQEGGNFHGTLILRGKFRVSN